MLIRRGIGLITYNRGNYLREFIQSVQDTAPKNCRVVLVDDGSTDATAEVARCFDITYIRGPNLGVSTNKNRALYALQESHFISIIEDDLFPTSKGWFEIYEQAAIHSGIHHFCRVQDKEVPESHPEFTEWMTKELKLTPIYSPTPRGDFTFITAEVLRQVGGLHPDFIGAGYAHGNWSHRIAKAGLIGHPLKWVDVKEARDMFVQKGDTEGGRWNHSKNRTKDELRRNRAVDKKLEALNIVHVPLVMP
jgi:glycosyltransferase involved in cell wall biosynthesis